jgi:hypothetical protein
MLIPSSENLALLGNVCSLDTVESRKIYKNFLDYCSSNYKEVYIVPGVWEMSSYKPESYHTSINNLYNLKKQYKNINILNNSHVNIPNTDITIIGSTLWVRHPYMKHQCMAEYNYIWMNRHSGLGQLMGDDIVNWHYEDLDFIKNMKNSSHKVIMLTHHLPHPVLVKNNIRKRMESSDLEHYINKPIEIWLGGAGNTSVTGIFGVCRDTFCGVNTYTTFNNANKGCNTTYDPEAYVSLRTSDIQLV